MLYVLASGAGALLAWNADVNALPSPPTNSVVRGLAAWNAPPPLPYVWSPSAVDWVVPTTPTPAISRQTFMDRIPTTVQAMVHTLELANTAQGAAVRGWLLRFNIVESVTLTDNRTIDSVNALIGLAVANGVVASADMAAVIAAILA